MADVRPLALDLPERTARSLRVLHRKQFLCFGDQCPLLGEVLLLLGIPRVVRFLARSEELLLCSSEALPQSVVVLLARPRDAGLPV